MGEWFSQLVQEIESSFKEKLIEACTGIFNGLFNGLNDKINWAGNTISESPASWSSGIFSMIQSISETVIFPIAGIIITYIFCYEIITMVTEANSMKTISPTQIMLTLIKVGVAVMILSNSFKIVMAFFDLGNYVTSKLTAASASTGGSVDISEVLASESIISLIGALLLLLLAWLIVWIVTAAIYIQINIWFIEIFIYSSAAAIPFATFLNKEWGQMGLNYTRKIMALAFQSFFMLLCLTIYSARLSDVGSASGNLAMTLLEVVGGGFILVLMLFKSGNISNSIFNAH